MNNMPNEENAEERGASCPYCKQVNIIYEDTCGHYSGYFNVAESAWELCGDDMAIIQKKLEQEFAKVKDQIEEGLGQYETNRLREILPSASYEIDAEEIAVGPRDFSNATLIFLDKDGRAEAQRFIESNK